MHLAVTKRASRLAVRTNNRAVMGQPIVAGVFLTDMTLMAQWEKDSNDARLNFCFDVFG